VTELELENMMDRAFEAYSATRATIGLEDIGHSDAYQEATEELARWFVGWFDEHEAGENQTEEDADAEQVWADSFAELWLEALEERQDMEETERSLSMASNFI
jgi:hypothetical protein